MLLRGLDVELVTSMAERVTSLIVSGGEFTRSFFSFLLVENSFISTITVCLLDKHYTIR